MKFITVVATIAAAVPLVAAHTTMGQFFIDGDSQTDGTCIRMPRDGSTATAPVKGLTSKDMACGADGDEPAAFVCPVSAGATLTFEFREWPDASQGGAIDKSHRGACSVWYKRVDDMFSDPASGPGWTKFWHEGYDEDAARWCTEKLIDNKGLLSVELPSGLPAGDYLVRTELLALHQAASLDDPQYYVSCVQLHLGEGADADPSVLSSHAVSIPGHVDGSEPGNRFDIYERPMDLPYPIPGPPPFSPAGTPSGSPPDAVAAAFEGAIPDDCVTLNSNWCGRPLPRYSDEKGCWAAVEACFAQGTRCYDATSPVGVKGCDAWNRHMCHGIQAECRAKNFSGPPAIEIRQHTNPAKGPIPPAVNKGAGSARASSAGGSTRADSDQPAASTSAASSPTATTPSNDDDYNDDDDDDDDDDIATSPIYEAIPSSSPPSTPSATSTSAPAPAPDDDSKAGVKPGPGLAVSPDGSCGGVSGYTCLGSRFGDCCSRYGRCGRRSRACGCHCQSSFGLCNDKSQA